MLTIAWDPKGFHLIDAMIKGEKRSASLHSNNIIIPICQRLILAGRCKLVIHPDNSPCLTAKVVLDFVSQRKVRFARHPPDSPDIAPSGFFLFVYLKGQLRGSHFQTAKELPAKVRELMGKISTETLLEVFHDWTACCENVTAIDGNYFEQTIKW
jgi:hypothetical protein